MCCCCLLQCGLGSGARERQKAAPPSGRNALAAHAARPPLKKPLIDIKKCVRAWGLAQPKSRNQKCGHGGEIRRAPMLIARVCLRGAGEQGSRAAALLLMRQKLFMKGICGIFCALFCQQW